MGNSPNGINIPSQKLQELRRQCMHHNVFPIFLPNAFYDNEPEPVFKVLSKVVADFADQLACLTPQEFHGEIQRLPEQIQMLLGDPPADPFEREFLERVAVFHVVWAVDTHYNDFQGALKPFDLASEVGQAFPELADHIDDEGLLRLGPEFDLHDGGINYRDHVLHFHQCLRRGFSSNPNFSFTARFAAYYRKLSPSTIFRVAIDPRRLMHQSQYQQLMEFDAWQGPLFDPKHLDDLNHFGLTVIKRERPSLFDFSNRLDRTEFYWAADRKNGIKSFEIEELPPEEVTCGSLRITRYIHTERDTQGKRIRHFDGAAKVYESLGSYRARVSSQLPMEPRADRKPKLFRLDGDIPLDAWIDLVGMFFKGNEMVLRYFDSDRYEAVYRDRIEQFNRALSEGVAPNA